MSTTDAGSSPAEASVPASAPVANPWPGLLIASILAAVAAGGLAETPLVRVVAADTDVVLLGQKFKGASKETLLAAKVQTAARTFGVLGLGLGFAAGYVGASTAGTRGARLRAGAVGAVAAALVGAIASFVVVPMHERNLLDGATEQTQAYIAHVGLWVPVGAAAGLAMGLGLGRSKIAAAAVGGALGAMIGSIVFDIVGGLAFPTGGIHETVPSSVGSRLTAAALLVVPSAALALVASTTSSRKKPAEPTAVSPTA